METAQQIDAMGSDIIKFEMSANTTTNYHLPLDCLLYTSDAADERSSVDLGGRRIIKKKKTRERRVGRDELDTS